MPHGKMKCIMCDNDNFSSKEKQSKFAGAPIISKLRDISQEKRLNHTMVVCYGCTVANALGVLSAMIRHPNVPGGIGKIQYENIANAFHKAAEILFQSQHNK